MANYREYAFEKVLDAVAAGILLTDDDTVVLYMNCLLYTSDAADEVSPV